MFAAFCVGVASAPAAPTGAAAPAGHAPRHNRTVSAAAQKIQRMNGELTAWECKDGAYETGSRTEALQRWILKNEWDDLVVGERALCELASFKLHLKKIEETAATGNEQDQQGQAVTKQLLVMEHVAYIKVLRNATCAHANQGAPTDVGGSCDAQGIVGSLLHRAMGRAYKGYCADATLKDDPTTKEQQAELCADEAFAKMMAPKLAAPTPPRLPTASSKPATPTANRPAPAALARTKAAAAPLPMQSGSEPLDTGVKGMNLVDLQRQTLTYERPSSTNAAKALKAAAGRS